MIDLKPYPKQKAVLVDQHTYVISRSSRRSGKTQTGLMKLISVCFGFDNWMLRRTGQPYKISPTSPAIAVVVCPSRPMVQALWFKPLLSLIEATPALKKLVKNVNRSTMTIDLHGNRPSIVFASLGSDGSGDSLRGKAIALALIDECQDLSYDAIQTVIKVAMVDVPGSQMLILGTPKGRGNNALWRFSQLAAKHPNIASEHHLTIYDNPFISPDAIAEEKLLKTEAIFNREFLAEYMDFAGSIYQNLGEHTIAEIPQGKPYRTWLGVDFGSINSAIVVVGIYDGVFYILDAWQNLSGATVSNNAFNQVILSYAKHYDAVGTFCDPSRKDSIVDLQSLGRDNGVIGAAKAVTAWNPIFQGITQLQALLEHEKLFIGDNHDRRIGNVSPRQLLEDMSSYTWLTDRDGVVIEGKIPDGLPDHTLDSLRYALARANPYSLKTVLDASKKIKPKPSWANFDSPDFDTSRILQENHLKHAGGA